MIYGYARVSTIGQARDGNSLEVQERDLRAAGAEQIFADSFTGTKSHRPQLDRLMSVLQSGDTVVVCKLDRIARSTKGGIEIIEEFISRGCTLNVLNMGRFDDTPTSRLMVHIMLAFAEFERDMIVQRTTEGKDAKRSRGELKEGRPHSVIDMALYRELECLYSARKISAEECASKLGVSRSTFFRLIKQSA